MNIDRFNFIIENRLSESGLVLHESTQVLSNDPTTLFVCAGMQLLKPRFENPDQTNYATIQNCIRSIDLDKVGDGTHLTFFKMLGTFGFGTNNYAAHCNFWDDILNSLDIRVDSVHVHPNSNHKPIWESLKYEVVDDISCQWSDGNIGGYCSEMFVDNLEIGNLVNPNGHSVDVGFGYERLYQVACGKGRVDETDLFRQDLDPISRDHYRTLECFWNDNIFPGNKGANYVCRRILRRFIRLNPTLETVFSPWMETERIKMDKAMRDAQRHYKKHSVKPAEFWWDSFGILPEEVPLLRM